MKPDKMSLALHLRMRGEEEDTFLNYQKPSGERGKQTNKRLVSIQVWSSKLF